MTRRERLTAKLEKRQEWAAKAEARSNARWKASGAATAGIPFGQPILVGHHSEKRHRRALERAQNNATKACEEMDLAKHHVSKAGGLADQLERTIFSDDADAIEQLERKAAALETLRATMRAANAWWRKHTTMKGCPGISDEQAATLDADIPTRHSWERSPFAPYQLSNLGARIRDARERIKVVQRRQERAAAAEAAGGVVIEGGDYVAVTFADKPARATLEALKAGGFRWANGSWCGFRANLPAGILPEVTP